MKGYQPTPVVLLVPLMNTDVTGHELDLNYNIQRKQNDSFTIFADCKRQKQCWHAC